MSALRLSDYRTGSVRLVPLHDNVTGWEPDGEVERRYVLADTDDTPPPMRPVTGILSRTEARSRTRHARVTDAAVVDALRAADGNLTRAAAIVGITPQGMRSRTITLERLWLLPDDVAEMIDARRSVA